MRSISLYRNEYQRIEYSYLLCSRAASHFCDEYHPQRSRFDVNFLFTAIHSGCDPLVFGKIYNRILDSVLSSLVIMRDASHFFLYIILNNFL